MHGYQGGIGLRSGGYEHAIRAENVQMWFGNVGALTNVNLTVGRNEIVGLVGDNGAGKSTLIKIITGVLKPTAGDLYIRDEKVDWNHYSVLKAHQSGIETVYPATFLVPATTSCRPRSRRCRKAMCRSRSIRICICRAFFPWCSASCRRPTRFRD